MQFTLWPTKPNENLCQIRLDWSHQPANLSCPQTALQHCNSCHCWPVLDRPMFLKVKALCYIPLAIPWATQSSFRKTWTSSEPQKSWLALRIALTSQYIQKYVLPVFVEFSITDFATFVYLCRLSEVVFPALVFRLCLILSFEPL